MIYLCILIQISNFEDTDIVPLLSRVSPVSSGDTVTSKLHCSDAASNNYLPKINKNANIFLFYCQILVYLDFFL